MYEPFVFISISVNVSIDIFVKLCETFEDRCLNYTNIFIAPDSFFLPRENRILSYLGAETVHTTH